MDVSWSTVDVLLITHVVLRLVLVGHTTATLTAPRLHAKRVLTAAVLQATTNAMMEVRELNMQTASREPIAWIADLALLVAHRPALSRHRPALSRHPAILFHHRSALFHHRLRHHPPAALK
jgi:hypothetical protein